MSHWTFDMNRCRTCKIVTTCDDRQEIKKALSKSLHKLNMTENTAGKEPIGVVVVACNGIK